MTDDPRAQSGQKAQQTHEQRLAVFESRVFRTNRCWLWTGGIAAPHKPAVSYGSFWFNGRNVLAHRFSYEAYVGPIPEGLQIDHLCRVSWCVNPDHLEPVTGSVNTLRGTNSALRPPTIQKSHCKHGHEYTEANTFYNKAGIRWCRLCRTASNRRSKRRQALRAGQQKGTANE